MFMFMCTYVCCFLPVFFFQCLLCFRVYFLSCVFFLRSTVSLLLFFNVSFFSPFFFVFVFFGIGGVLGVVGKGGPKDASHDATVGTGGVRRRQAPRVGDDDRQDHLPRPRGVQEVGRDPVHAANRRVPLVRDRTGTHSLNERRGFFLCGWRGGGGGEG